MYSQLPLNTHRSTLNDWSYIGTPPQPLHTKRVP